jgi:translation initiation factor 1
MADSNDWKKRLGVVFSTNPDFDFETGSSEQKKTPQPAAQTLYIQLDKKQRKGKVVTLISGFKGSDADLQELGRELKKKCGTGGSVKDGFIIIQGDFKTRLSEVLNEMSYRVKFK